MKYLIDTHIFIWWIVGDVRLPKKAISILLNTKNQVFVSAVTAWEMTLKQQKGTLKLQRSFDEYFKSTSFEELPVEFGHISSLNKLPSIHKDPFDRLLVAQAMAERVPLISVDPIVKKYPIKTIS